MRKLSSLPSIKGVKARNVLFVLLGVVALVLKQHYAGPGEQTVHSWGGNFAVSFALYFLFLQPPIRGVLKKPVAAGLALACAELFEALDGFGFMANTYDPVDFFANALGVAFALAVDCMLHFRLHRGQANRKT